MAHLTGQNGLSDVTGKRLLKHDWTDWTVKGKNGNGKLGNP